MINSLPPKNWEKGEKGRGERKTKRKKKTKREIGNSRRGLGKNMDILTNIHPCYPENVFKSPKTGPGGVYGKTGPGGVYGKTGPGGVNGGSLFNFPVPEQRPTAPQRLVREAAKKFFF